MGKPKGKSDHHGNKNGSMKEFFTTFTVQDSTGKQVEGVFGFDAYAARKALLTARQKIGSLQGNLPQDGGYRSNTVSLSDEVYTDMGKALAKIGVYNTATDMDGKLLIEVR